MSSLSFRRQLLGRAAALVAAAWLASCGEDKRASAKPTTRVAQPVVLKSLVGVDTYRQALATADTEEALRLLHAAVQANRNLTEAWYTLGRLKLKLAPEIVKTEEERGVMMFREGLEAEREALALLDAGKVTVWSKAEVDDARTALDRDLLNVDEVMADHDSLLAALRLRTY
jgi:hypothetical protein